MFKNFKTISESLILFPSSFQTFAENVADLPVSFTEIHGMAGVIEWNAAVIFQSEVCKFRLTYFQKVQRKLYQKFISSSFWIDDPEFTANVARHSGDRPIAASRARDRVHGKERSRPSASGTRGWGGRGRRTPGGSGAFASSHEGRTRPLRRL